MTKIYTKTGDKGETGLFGGPRVRKSHPRIMAYGSIDELNALLGQVRSQNDHADLDKLLERIRHDLFDIGAILATPDAGKLTGRSRTTVDAASIGFLEETIDRYDHELPALRSFVLPGGGVVAALLHVARTVCRRAEREIVLLEEREPVEPNVIVYVNRLSDLLFVLARWVNLKQGLPDIPWKKK